MELLTDQTQKENKAINEDMMIHSVTGKAAGSRGAENIRTEGKAYVAIKRTQDLMLSFVALFLLWPLLVFIALLIVIDDPGGGPIFTQVRCGKDNKQFKFYKFRTMVVNAEAEKDKLMESNEMDGPVFKIKDDPRITRIGKFLRRTSLDELPQLVNIIKGQMSIVGPRPPIPEEVKEYDDYQMQRLSVLPGLTCYWQTNPQRYQLSFEEWIELDLKYIKERSYLLDWKLIFKTVRTMLMGHGE